MKRFLFVTTLFILCVPAFADSIDDAEAKQRGVPVSQVQAENKLREAQKQIDALTSKVSSLQQQNKLLSERAHDQEIQLSKQKITIEDDARREAVDAKAIEAMKLQIADLTGQATKLKAAIPKPSYTLAKGMTLEAAKSALPGQWDLKLESNGIQTFSISWMASVVLPPPKPIQTSGLPRGSQGLAASAYAAPVMQAVQIGQASFENGKLIDYALDKEMMSRIPPPAN